MVSFQLIHHTLYTQQAVLYGIHGTWNRICYSLNSFGLTMSGERASARDCWAGPLAKCSGRPPRRVQRSRRVTTHLLSWRVGWLGWAHWTALPFFSSSSFRVHNLPSTCVDASFSSAVLMAKYCSNLETIKQTCSKRDGPYKYSSKINQTFYLLLPVVLRMKFMMDSSVRTD